jgi:hypothetical protein
MTASTTPAAEATQHRDIVSRLQDESDICRSDGAGDIAQLLDDAVTHIQQRALEFLSAEGQAMEREGALIAERDQLRAALPQWLPIETAPKDGSAVLVAPGIWDSRSCSIAAFASDKYAAKPRPYWRRDDDMGKVAYSRQKPPTHWMPLSALAAPAVEGE